MGRLIAEFLYPVVKTLRVVDEHEEFWKEHDLEAIPQHLLMRISELGGCKLIKSGIEDLYEPHKEFLDNISRSKIIRGISPIFFPIYPEFFLQQAQKEVEISLILTKNVYDKINREYYDALAQGLSLDNTKIYICDDMKLACIVTDCFFSLSLFFKNGIFDSQIDLVSFDESALKWGRDLFDYYRNRSVEIRNL
jgi:predicted transcriptional regulator